MSTCFADDTKIHSKISNVNDCVSLQEHLDNLKKWSDIWLFHPNKCKVLRLGNRIDEAYEYKLDYTPLKHTQSEKGLGVVISQTW